MAFFGRLGNLLRLGATRQITSEMRSSASIFQTRCTSSTKSAPSTKLLIGGISYFTDERSLRETFAQFGEVTDARIFKDPETGRSSAYGFIHYTTVEEASSALQAMDGQDLHGRRVRVFYAAPTDELPNGFYTRPLRSPPAINFLCDEGKELYLEAVKNGTMEGFYKLISHFQTQAEPTFCGVSSLVMVLNTLGIDPGMMWREPFRWFDETTLGCCKPPLVEIKDKGITFDQLVYLA